MKKKDLLIPKTEFCKDRDNKYSLISTKEHSVISYKEILIFTINKRYVVKIMLLLLEHIYKAHYITLPHSSMADITKRPEKAQQLIQINTR